MMATTMLKEIEFPKYVRGKSYDDFFIKLIHAAGTRGNMKLILEGKYMDLMPGYIEVDGARIRGNLSDEQKTMEKENDRVLAELIMAMPDGPLTRLVHKSKSDSFPQGCAYTALKALKKRINKVSFSNMVKLQEKFMSNVKLSKTDNPAKYLEKLICIRDKLYDRYQK